MLQSLKGRYVLELARRISGLVHRSAVDTGRAAPTLPADLGVTLGKLDPVRLDAVLLGHCPEIARLAANIQQLIARPRRPDLLQAIPMVVKFRQAQRDSLLLIRARHLACPVCRFPGVDFAQIFIGHAAVHVER